MNNIKHIITTVAVCLYFVGCKSNANQGDLNVSADVVNRLRQIFSDDKLTAALTYGEESMERTKRLDQTIALKMKVRKNNTISYAQMLDGLSTPKAREYDYLGQKFLKATSHLLHSHCIKSGISNQDCVKYLSSLRLPESSLVAECLNIQQNIENHRDEMHIYRRLLRSDYKDAIYKIRETNLPSPRQIAELCYSSNIIEGVADNRRSVALAQWTQFIEHDLTKTTMRTMSNGAAIECCSTSHSTPAPRYRHPSCETLKISEQDKFYQSRRVTCLNYVRSAVFTEDCKLGSADQLNQASAHFDLSQLYGNHDDPKLRRFVNGELLSSSALTDPTLPQTDDYCGHNRTNCFYSGDSRVNLNPYIAMLHTIFLRSHNSLAMKLKKLNPHWTDDKLFTFAKKINTGIYQKIVYEEWSKVVLGGDLTNEILSERTSSRNHRDSNRVSNEFATAAIKFYNTMMPGDLYKASRDMEIENVVDTPTNRIKLFSLEDSYFNGNVDRSYPLETVLTALLQQKAMAMDINYVDDLSNKLYKIPNTDFGTDSLALDIQRGRDHGFPGYVKYLEKCQDGVRINDWSDLSGFINESDLQRFKKVYSSVHDMDLIIGLISEKSVADATIGPTLMCIIGDQLSHSRKNDLHFYSRPSQKKLMKTIASYTAARLLCDVTNISAVQENIFLVPSRDNPIQSCNSEHLPVINLSLWREV